MLPALRSRSSKLLLYSTHSSRRQFYHGGRPPFSSTEDHIPDPRPNRPSRGEGGGGDRSFDNRPLRGGGGDRSFDNRPLRDGGGGRGRERSIDNRQFRGGGDGERSFENRQPRGGGGFDRGRRNFDDDENRTTRNKFDNFPAGNAVPHQNPNPRFDEEKTPEFSRRPSAGPSASEKSADFLEKFKLGFDKSEKPLLNIQSDKTETGNQAAEPRVPPPQDADEIFRKMKETGLIPDTVAMLDGLCKDGLVQDAMKLFSFMREKGTIPEVVVYTAVVDAFCKVRKFDDAIRIFKKMQDNGIVPNAYTYNVLVQGLCKGENVDDSVEFCLEMLEAGHSPNLTTFTGLVDLLCNKNGVEEAKTVIARLKEKGYFLDEKAGREHLEKKGPFSQLVWEAIFGIKESQKRNIDVKHRI